MSRGGGAVPADVPSPPGLPPAVCAVRHSASSTALLFLVVVALLLGYAVMRGGNPVLTSVLCIALVGGGFLALQSARFALAAGPGWLSVRGVVRHRWVRTDRLVRIGDGAVGVDRVLTFADSDGRSLGVQLSALTGVAAAHAQVLRDVRTSMAAGLVLSDVTRGRLGL